ncbi:hypothetical protein [Streptomyces sp. NPDC002690]
MSLMFLVAVVFAVVWWLIARVPRRTPSAAKGWGMGVLGASVLIVPFSYLLSSNIEVSATYTGPSPQNILTLVAAIAVAPGAITALVRIGKNG